MLVSCQHKNTTDIARQRNITGSTVYNFSGNEVADKHLLTKEVIGESLSMKDLP